MFTRRSGVSPTKSIGGKKTEALVALKLPGGVPDILMSVRGGTITRKILLEIKEEFYV